MASSIKNSISSLDKKVAGIVATAIDILAM